MRPRLAPRRALDVLEHFHNMAVGRIHRDGGASARAVRGAARQHMRLRLRLRLTAQSRLARASGFPSGVAHQAGEATLLQLRNMCADWCDHLCADWCGGAVSGIYRR